MVEVSHYFPVTPMDPAKKNNYKFEMGNLAIGQKDTTPPVDIRSMPPVSLNMKVV